MKRPKASRIRWLKARKGTREEEEEEEEKNQEIRNAMEREMAEKKRRQNGRRFPCGNQQQIRGAQQKIE